MSGRSRAIGYAVLAAVCYGVSAPLSKLLLEVLSPALLAALLYLGAGLGMGIVSAVRGAGKRGGGEARLGRREWPYILAMILLDIAAPVLLMWGLSLTSAATVALLNNFEIVATAIIAAAVFKEAIGQRLWIAMGFIVVASALLSVEDLGGLRLSWGALLALGACVCWGFENNCTRMLSLKDPLAIVVVKGFGSGLGALIVALVGGNKAHTALFVACGLLLGFFAYGLSIYFYILAQRQLGAARTGAFYAFAPFVGVVLSAALFAEGFSALFWAALGLMGIGAYFAAFERHKHDHAHDALAHEHRHNHGDGHHDHGHDPAFAGSHSHPHIHGPVRHTHAHAPDLHHTHRHG